MQNKLKEAREAAGMTQKTLSELSGVTRPTIWAIENNSKEAVLTTTMFKLAKALNKKIEDIFLF